MEQYLRSSTLDFFCSGIAACSYKGANIKDSSTHAFIVALGNIVKNADDHFHGCAKLVVKRKHGRPLRAQRIFHSLEQNER